MARKVATLAAVLALGALLVASLGGPGVAKRKSRSVHAVVKDETGTRLGKVRFTPRKHGTVVSARFSGLAAGFHGFHVHTTGECDPTATDTSGAPSPFFTAGGHYNPTGATHGDHAGDMVPLLATEDGIAVARFLTDRFTVRDLMDEDGSAVIVHAGRDNLAHVPATTKTGEPRYHSHAEDVFGPDSDTKATGDAGARSGCGVVIKKDKD